MSLLDSLFKGFNPPSSDPARGGGKWGKADETYRTIEIGQRQPVKVVTGSLTLTPYESGHMIAVRSAAACVLTLPAAGTSKGVWFDFFNAADQDLKIAAPADNTMITFNDLDADFVEFTTSSEKIGAAGRVISDGVSWLLAFWTQETVTPTVDT